MQKRSESNGQVVSTRRKYVYYLHLHTIPRYIPGSPRRLRGAIRLHGILRKRPAAVILKFITSAQPFLSIQRERTESAERASGAPAAGYPGVVTQAAGECKA